MKKALSFMLVIAMLLTQLALPVFADAAGDGWFEPDYVDPYEGLAVQSITITEGKPLIKDVSGWEDELYDENGEVIGTYFRYDISYSDAVVKVVFENGEIEENVIGELYYWLLEIYDEQSEEPWGVGKHQVTLVYRGVEATFEVEVIDNPVKSFTAVAQEKLVEGWDSYEVYEYDENGEELLYTEYEVYDTVPVFTITMKDGTVYTGTDEEIFQQTGYWTFAGDNQAENPFKIGKNTVKFIYMGVECECEIQVLPNPYKNVSIKGDKEVYLVFEGVDEKDSFETKIVSTYPYYEEFMEITTENGNVYEIDVYSDYDENGNATLDKNVSIGIGPFTTNTLESCSYFKAVYYADRMSTDILRYYVASETITGKRFEGYKAGEEIDINNLVALSTYISSDYMNYEVEDGYGVYTLSVEEVENNIEKIFGITDADVKSSDFYSGILFGKVKITDPWIDEAYIDETQTVYADGKWVAISSVVDFMTDVPVGTLTVVLNDDLTVDSIAYEEIEIEAGDVNCDGEVTAVDARVILQYVAGLIDEYDFYAFYADVNNDGEITALDARVILQQVAGLIK